MGSSPPGSSVHGILQARILEWVFMPSSRQSSQARDQTPIYCIAVRFFTDELLGHCNINYNLGGFYTEKHYFSHF